MPTESAAHRYLFRLKKYSRHDGEIHVTESEKYSRHDESQRNTVGIIRRVLTQDTLAWRASRQQPVVICLNCPLLVESWVRDTQVGRGMEEGRITGNGWRTEQKWKSEKDLREEQQEEGMDVENGQEEEEDGERITEQLMTVKAEVTMIDTDSLGR